MAKRVIRYDPEEAFPGIAGEAIAEGDFIGLSSAGTLFKADADATHGAAATNKAQGFAVKAAAVGERVYCAARGIIDGFSNLTKGDRGYLDTTAGGMTQTQPTTNTQTVQDLGVARTATEFWVNVGPPFQYQTAGNSVQTFL
jgi:hypothetical protein